MIFIIYFQDHWNIHIKAFGRLFSWIGLKCGFNFTPARRRRSCVCLGLWRGLSPTETAAARAPYGTRRWQHESYRQQDNLLQRTHPTRDQTLRRSGKSRHRKSLSISLVIHSVYSRIPYFITILSCIFVILEIFYGSYSTDWCDRDVDEIFYDLSLLFDHTFYTGYGDGIASQPQGNDYIFNFASTDISKRKYSDIDMPLQ